MTCRICLEEGNTTSVCDCKGTHGQVHLKCVRKWIESSGKTECEICKVEYHSKVVTNPFFVVYPLGVLNALTHSCVVFFAYDSIWYVSLICLFNLIQMLLWNTMYEQEKTESIVCIVVWTDLHFVLSVFLQLYYGVATTRLLHDYLLSLFMSVCCCMQTLIK